MAEQKNLWSNPASRLTYDGVNYKGSFFYNGIEFAFTMIHQTSGKYVMRGRISAISPTTGRIMTKPCTNVEGTETAEEKITAEIYSNGTDEATVKSTIQMGVEKMFSKHALTFGRALQITAKPDTIIPSVAAVLYADTFVGKKHSRLKASSAKKYADEIKKFFCRLPQVPMAHYRSKIIQDELKNQKTGKNKTERLRVFWQYLQDCGHVAGNIDPFPPKEKRKVSAGRRQQNVERVDELTLAQQDKLYDIIMGKKVVHGGDCGVALYVWGGFVVDDNKRWGDLIIRDADDSFAVMAHRRDDLSGATHTFDRPLFPQAVNVLLLAKNRLLENYTEKQLCDMPIISMVNDPTKRMKTNSLYQYAGKLLREIGLREADFKRSKKDERTAVSKRILLNTYNKNLYLRIGLTWDDGALQYLQGLSLSGNTTNDNYTSYSDNDAAARLHTAMMAIQPTRRINTQDVIIQDTDTGKIVTILPQYTRELTGAVGRVTLAPGARIRITCRHGVLGELRVQGNNCRHVKAQIQKSVIS